MAYFEFIWTEKMTNPDIQRVRRPATAEEDEQFERCQEQIAQDLPDLRRQALAAEADMRLKAMREPTVSGQLRCAIAESGIDHRELAARTGLSPKTLAEFLVGRDPLDSTAVDKLAAILKQELKPIG